MKLPLPSSPPRKKRYKEWENWLTNFQQQFLQNKSDVSIKYIPNAAWLLNDLYWRLAEQYLRPLLLAKDHKEVIHPYKIISASEITVMMVEPIQVPGAPKTEKRYNALLAWFIATQIIEGWNSGSQIEIKSEQINAIAGYKENITNSKRYPESFAAEHIKWLMNLNVTVEKPLLINAQCWRLFYIACLTLRKNKTGKNEIKPKKPSSVKVRLN